MAKKTKLPSFEKREQKKDRDRAVERVKREVAAAAKRKKKRKAARNIVAETNPEYEI